MGREALLSVACQVDRCKRMRRYFLAGAMILALSPPLRAVQSIKQQLQTKVQNYDLSEPTFVDALASVASRFKIPVGIELVAAPSTLQPFKLSKRRATVMQILTALVRGEQGYDLRVDGGIVHIFPKDFVGQPSNFLNLPIKRFRVLEVGAAVAQRRAWEIVNAKFEPPKPLPPGPHGTISSMFGGGSVRTFSLDLRCASVRHILDKIALSSDYPIWVVAFAPDRSLTSTGFRRTASPKSGKVGELGWEMLRWGDKPY